MAMPAYSDFFTCLYDEPAPVGHLGRGAHYSVLRCAEWFDVERRPLPRAEVHDFAVIWDEDHDTRVIDVVERIYLEGLLSPVQFIGERKGTLTVIVAARFYWNAEERVLEDFKRRVSDIAASSSVSGDSWTTEIGSFDRSPTYPPHQTYLAGLIQSTEHKIDTYVRNIDNLWSLGTRPLSSLQPS